MTQNEYNLLVGSQYDATYEDLTQIEQTKTLAEEKAKKLAERTQEKLDKLKLHRDDYENLSNTATLMPNGLWESNKNKIWNNLSDVEIQTMLSEAANKSLVVKDGKYYNAVTGEEYLGDTRRAYMYGTKTDPNAVKFGLARGDLPSSDYRYQPGRAESEGFNVGKDGYGWEPGENGVDVTKNYMDMLLPYDVATALEGVVHGRAKALENRQYKDILSPEAVQHASGTSEYYTSSEGVLGDTSKVSMEEIANSDKGLIEKYSSIVPNTKYTKDYADLAKQINAAADTDGRIMESIDLAQSAGLKLWGDMSAAAIKAIRSLISAFGVNPDDIGFKENTRLLGTDELVENVRKNEKLRDEVVGYGTRDAWQAEQLKYQTAVGGSKYGEAAWNVVMNLDRYLAESAPEMGLLMVPYAGIPSLVGTRLSNQMEEFEANNNREMTPDEMLSTGATILATLVPEKLLVKTGANSVLNKLTRRQGTKDNAVIGVGISAGEEALQEGSEAVQEQWATGKAEDRTDLNKLAELATNDQTIGGVIAGGAMGGALRGAGEAIAATPDALGMTVDATKRGIELATETPIQKEQRINREFSAPLREEAINAAITGDANVVANNVNKIHGKLSEQLDESADDSLTYGIVFREALAKAANSNDEAQLTNVYKTMAELDKNENVNFKVKNLVDEMTYSATQEFLKLINQNTETADVKMQELGKEVAESISTKATTNENILKEVQALKLAVEAQQKSLKSVMGSDEFDSVNNELEKLKTTIEEYIQGKDLTAVNNEFAELGFIVAGEDSINADPNRPGLKVYERELTNQLLNTKTNKNLLDEKVNKSARVKLTGLTNFAESRLRKLDAGKYQTKALIEGLLKENKQMVDTITNVLTTAKKLKSVDEATKKAYIAELTKAAKAAVSSSKELERRQKILNSIEDEGSYAFELTKDGSEIIQKITGKDAKGKYTKVKYADIVDNKLVKVESKKVEKPAKVQPEEVANKEEYYNRAKVEEVKTIIKEKAGKPEEYTKEEEQIIENAKDSGVLQQANKELVEEIKQAEQVKEYTGPLASVRSRVDSIDKELSALLDNVKDMDVKQTIKEFYTKKLNEINSDKVKVNKLIDRLEATLDKRVDRKYGESTNLIKGIVGQIDKLVRKMLNQIKRLRTMVSGLNQKYKKLNDDMNSLLKEINEVEAEYTSKPTKTTVGKVTTIDESLYGKPVLEVNGKRIEVTKRVSEKTGKEVAQSTAINDALELVKMDKVAELRDELKSMPKGRTSLNAKLIGRMLLNFPMNSLVHRIIKRTNDSVFGKLTGNPFADTNRILDVLPNTFKEFFASDKESRETLIENINTMATYIDNVKIDKIVVSENSLLKNIDNNGLAIKHINKYVPIERELIKNDKVKDASGQTYTIKNINGDKIDVVTSGKNGKSLTKNINEFTEVLEQQEESVPVNIIELIGTVKDGVLEIDEQTKNILKFYTAKMLSDSNTMIGKILSFDESEMSQYLGITDPDEQIRVKQEARQGYVNSASIRKDIGSEVYQSLGIKFDETTPEFTVESFKSALGVLVQAIAVENNSMSMKAAKSNEKNQNLVKVNWDSIGVDKNSLIKSINKLQYMNENRSRPLPSLKEPKDDNNRKVMNTNNAMDKKSIAFLNKQEKIAYTISPNLKHWLEMDEKDALKAMGYIDVETANLHVSEIDAQIARNDKLVREWEILKTFAKSVGDKKFYVKWGQTVSGRYTILSDIQYQESKLHREFVVAEGSVETVDPKSADGRDVLEASIMQGLDMDPDKLSAETATKKFNETFKVTDSGIEVVKDGPIKQAYDALRKDKMNVEAMAEVFADSEGHHGLASIELLVEWDKALKEGTKIKTHANLEIDAITSGMILTLLQIGSNQAIRLAEKGGIYTTERKAELETYVKKWLGKDVVFTPGALIEAGKKHAAEIEAKMKTATGKELADLRKELEDDAVFKDLYSTIGVAMIGEVQEYKNKLELKLDKNADEVKQLAMLEQIGELNLKNIRSIAKSPVMVYIYGATTSSIKKKLTYSLGVDTFVKALKTASKKLKNSEDATKELTFIETFISLEDETYVDGFGIKVEKPKERWEQLLALDIQPLIKTIDDVINATFGTAIETAFESRLGFVDRNRNAAKSIEMLVFEAYQIRLADEVKAMLDEKYGPNKHKGEMYKLSKEDVQSINDRLTAQGYGHNIVWDEADGKVNQSLNKTGDKGGIHSTKVQVGNTSVGGQIKQFKPMVNTGAAPTISIHAIDGRMMMDVLNRELNGKYAGGNVYDAVVLSLNKAMLTDTANTYNTNMIETGFSRSIVADQLGMLENMLSTMNEDQKKRMFKNIGLRPEGELRYDYTKEANRLGLGIGKMLESIELAETINNERLANSSKAYYSGHLFQMGSGVVKVEAGQVRAKEFPAIESIKKLLKNRLETDRKVTHNEFAKAGIKLNPKTTYVFNLNDIANGETQVKSKANIAQINTVRSNGKYKLKLTDKQWASLSSNDTVEVIGEYKVPEKQNSQSWHYNNIMSQLMKSGATVIVNGEEVKKSENKREERVPEQKLDKVELTTQVKLEQLLEVYSTDTAPKIGGGLVENVTEAAVFDEDVAKATMEKWYQEESLKDMLPKIDGRKLSKYKKAVSAWYNENKRGSAIRETLNELIEIMNTVEQEPRLVEELGWDTVETKSKKGKMTANEIIKDALECAKG